MSGECVKASPVGQVLQGDCLSVMGEMEDGSVGLVLTSPPYNLRNTTGGWPSTGHGGFSMWRNAALREGYAEHDDNMPHDEYVEWQRACLAEMMRLIPDDGAIFYNHKWRVQAGLLQDRADIVDGFPVRQVIIWQRQGGMNFNDGYFLPTYEVIYLIAKPDFRLAKRANYATDVWSIPQESGTEHPAPFPLALAQRVVASTDAKVVLDPFCGSGTACVAAMLEGRDYIGIELTEEYCEMARQRLVDEARQGRMKL